MSHCISVILEYVSLSNAIFSFHAWIWFQKTALTSCRCSGTSAVDWPLSPTASLRRAAPEIWCYWTLMQAGSGFSCGASCRPFDLTCGSNRSTGRKARTQFDPSLWTGLVQISAYPDCTKYWLFTLCIQYFLHVTFLETGRKKLLQWENFL